MLKKRFGCFNKRREWDVNRIIVAKLKAGTKEFMNGFNGQYASWIASKMLVNRTH